MSSLVLAECHRDLYIPAMGANFADTLLMAIREKNAPVCVGLDPLLDRLPPSILANHDISKDGMTKGMDTSRCVAALASFGRELIDVVMEYVPSIKINIAFFERYFSEGVAAYFDLVRYAHEAGLLVIGDAKRADIGHTSDQYAIGHLADRTDRNSAVADALTINPYFGFDSIKPFLDAGVETGRGLFVLVQTSNESANEVQGLVLSDGTMVCERVAALVSEWATGEGLVGRSGYSSVGAVVSPRDLESTQRIRTLMPKCLFLVPGFGAQGRSAEEVATCFRSDGTGAIVNASRSVIYAHDQDRYRNRFGDDWKRCVREACLDFVQSIRSILPT
jgi:orotidine-5'-phosphate decarboxylase